LLSMNILHLEEEFFNKTQATIVSIWLPKHPVWITAHVTD
jgi:hypothetical protein